MPFLSHSPLFDDCGGIWPPSQSLSFKRRAEAVRKIAIKLAVLQVCAFLKKLIFTFLRFPFNFFPVVLILIPYFNVFLYINLSFAVAVLSWVCVL
jgi:hypothetical protein